MNFKAVRFFAIHSYTDQLHVILPFQVHSMHILRITDAQFEKMGLAIGQIASIKATLAETTEGTKTSEQNKSGINV